MCSVYSYIDYICTIINQQNIIIMDIKLAHQLVSASKKCKNVTQVTVNHNDVEVFTFSHKRKEFDCVDCGGLIVLIDENSGEFEINNEQDLLNIIK